MLFNQLTSLALALTAASSVISSPLLTKRYSQNEVSGVTLQPFAIPDIQCPSRCRAYLNADFNCKNGVSKDQTLLECFCRDTLVIPLGQCLNCIDNQTLSEYIVAPLNEHCTFLVGSNDTKVTTWNNVTQAVIEDSDRRVPTSGATRNAVGAAGVVVSVVVGVMVLV